MIWDLVLLVETFFFFFRKSSTFCRVVLIFLACEPAALPWLCLSALPAALWPPILRQVFQYWLAGSVLTSVSLSHCFAQAALFNRQKIIEYRRPCCLDGPACLCNLPRRREDVRACDAEAVCAVGASGSNAGSTGRKEGRAPPVFTLPLGRLDRENKL